MMLEVLPNDDGIRPAGPPDECFYCQQKVGQIHGAECAVMRQHVLLRAWVRDQGVFEWMEAVPFYWDELQIIFHYNHGTWCADNIPGIEEIAGECNCWKTTVEVVAIANRGPVREEP